jgi:5-methylcytosine-specific restriction enzyme subunit McrC
LPGGARNQAPVRRLTLVERQTAVSVRLAHAERIALQAALPEVVIAASGKPGHCDVTPGAWVGAVALDTLAVQVRPKLPVRSVLFMASYAAGLDLWRESPADLAEHESLIEVVAPLFAAHVRRAIGAGLLQGYHTEEAALPAVRGRLRFDEQLRSRFGRFPPAEVRYDELTHDVPENRLLKAAMLHLLRFPLRSYHVAAELHRLLARFGRVQAWQPGRSGGTGEWGGRTGSRAGEVPSIAYTPLNRRYHPALELARLVLRGASLELSDGRAPGAAFLLDMDRVFEDFVCAALRDALGLTARAFPQGCAGRRFALDAAASLPLLPDLSWWEGTRCAFVGDVKYKRTRHGEQADLYQVLAYATAAGLPCGLLVYAAGTDDMSAVDGVPGRLAVHEVVHAGTSLHVSALDLSCSPAEVLAQVATLAQRIRRLRGTGRVNAVA